MRTDEFDGFGPWIREVTSHDEVPRLFRDFFVDFSRALLVQKVPRDISRREADASMDLYDALIIVTTDSVTILGRVGESFSVRILDLADIFAIEDTVLLLDGRLVIRAKSGDPLEVLYNGSAREGITRLVTVLRRHAVTRDAVVDAPVVGSLWGEATRQADIVTAIERVIPGSRDYGIRSDAADLLRSEPGAIVLAGQPTTRVRPARAARLSAALAQRMNPAFVQGAVIVGGTGDVSVVHRRSWIARGGSDDLSRARTVLFAPRVDVVELTPHELYASVSVMRLRAGQGLVELMVTENSNIPGVLTQSCVNARQA